MGTTISWTGASPRFHDASYGDKFADSVTPDGFTLLSSGVFWWLINIRPSVLCFGRGIPVRWSLICLVDLSDSLVMTSYILATQIHAFALVGIYLKEPGPGIIA